MSIQKLAVIAGGLLMVALLALLGTSHLAMTRLKVNGPLYSDIALSKDIVADILPPPKYIIEPYLEATLALNDPKSVDMRIKRLDALRTEYDVRQNFWQKAPIDAELRRMLTEKTHAPAMRFWATLTHAFLPALKRNDTATVQAAYADMTAAYTEHRARVDELVVAANARVAKSEADALADETVTLRSVWAASLFMVGLLAAAVVLLLRSVVGPLKGMTGTMTSFAKGNLDSDVPYLDRKDEIGGMAQALLVFKDAMLRKKHAEEQAALEARSRAHREIREMEEWIARERPSFEEVAKRALDFRKRYLSNGAAAPQS